MDIAILELVFEKETNLETISKIIDKDKAFLCSLLKLKGYKEMPKALKIKLGTIKKLEE